MRIASILAAKIQFCGAEVDAEVTDSMRSSGTFTRGREIQNGVHITFITSTTSAGHLSFLKHDICIASQDHLIRAASSKKLQSIRKELGISQKEMEKPVLRTGAR
jgi:hypothetical protein